MVSEDNWYNFWTWLFKGSGGVVGYKTIINKSIAFDLMFGVIGIILFGDILSQVASKMIDIYYGLIFVLAVSSSFTSVSFLANPEIFKLADKHDGGLPDYVYPLYLPLLVLVISLCGWYSLSLEVFILLKGVSVLGQLIYLDHLLGFLVLASTVMSIRMAWSAYIAPSNLVFAIYEVRKIVDEDASELK